MVVRTLSVLCKWLETESAHQRHGAEHRLRQRGGMEVQLSHGIMFVAARRIALMLLRTGTGRNAQE